MNQLQTNELSELASFINEQYNGDLFAISRQLDNAVYLLQYVDQSHFAPQEVQNACFALNSVKECFFEAHREQQMKVVPQTPTSHAASE